VGEAGGPTSVCLAQAKELASRGHDVRVHAVGDVNTLTVTDQDGYVLTLYPKRVVVKSFAFAGILGKGMWSSVRRAMRWADVVHIHMARDLITLPAAAAARRMRVPYVAQTHGMIDRSDKRLAHLLDALVTRRVLSGAATVLSLTYDEDAALRSVYPRVSLLRVRNGIELGELEVVPERADEILFLARLQERKRPTVFVEVAHKLSRRLPGFVFTLVGPDGGEAATVQARIEDLGLQEVVKWTGPIAPDRVVERLMRARLYVLPSVDEVFPMTILEAFRAGTPVVATESLGIAADCARFGSAELTGITADEIAAGVLRALEEGRYADLQGGAARMLREHLDIGAVVDSIEQVYSDCLSSRA